MKLTIILNRIKGLLHNCSTANLRLPQCAPCLTVQWRPPHFLEECHRPTMVSPCSSIGQNVGTPAVAPQTSIGSDSSTSSSALTGQPPTSTGVLPPPGALFTVRPPGTCTSGALDKVFTRNKLI